MRPSDAADTSCRTDSGASVAVSGGDTGTDYASYMGTATLLALQRPRQDRVHPDELLFQVVHQTTELWLKLAAEQVDEAVADVRVGCAGRARLRLGRVSLAIRLITEDLEMLRRLAPRDFHRIRTVLGHGSGFESPGWRRLHWGCRTLGRAFADLLTAATLTVLDLYRGDLADPRYRLAEAMVDVDERIALWRAQHYKLATRILGQHAVGTQGTPVDTLGLLVDRQLYPELWAVRTHLTDTAAPLPP